VADEPTPAASTSPTASTSGPATPPPPSGGTAAPEPDIWSRGPNTPGRQSGPAAAGGGRERDWATQAVDQIDELVAKVRSRTTDKVAGLARTLVYGLLAAILGVMALILGVVLLVRVLDVVIPEEVWLAYLVMGAICCLGGAVCWSKRS